MNANSLSYLCSRAGAGSKCEMLPKILQEYVKNSKDCCGDIDRGSVSPSTALLAIQHDHENCLHYVLDSGVNPHGFQGSNLTFKETLASIAAKSGSYKCLALLFRLGVKQNWRLAKDAASSGNVQSLKMMMPCYTWHTAVEAAKSGNCKLLELVRNNMPQWSERIATRVAESAALAGNLECLQYARANGAVMTNKVAVNAAKHGNLACLKFAHIQGCGWDSDVTAVAAEHGNRDCLQYAINNGCAIDPNVFEYTTTL